MAPGLERNPCTDVCAEFVSRQPVGPRHEWEDRQIQYVEIDELRIRKGHSYRVFLVEVGLRSDEADGDIDSTSTGGGATSKVSS